MFQENVIETYYGTTLKMNEFELYTGMWKNITDYKVKKVSCRVMYKYYLIYDQMLNVEHADVPRKNANRIVSYVTLRNSSICL